MNEKAENKKIRGRKLQVMKCNRCKEEQLITRKIEQDEFYCWDCYIIVRKERTELKINNES